MSWLPVVPCLGRRRGERDHRRPATVERTGQTAGGPDRFRLNPRGLLWSEIGADDIVLVARDGRKLAGRHDVESTAMFIHAAVHRLGKACVMHTHMPYATALALTTARALDTRLSQN